jgi:uncharacterized Zn-binding protein involved in type VI secretion
MSNGIARVGDTAVTNHNGAQQTTIVTGSENVFFNGMSVARLGDATDVHSTGAGAHSSSIISGSPSVFINGRPMARTGDALSCGGTIISGSPNTFGI